MSSQRIKVFSLCSKKFTNPTPLDDPLSQCLSVVAHRADLSLPWCQLLSSCVRISLPLCRQDSSAVSPWLCMTFVENCTYYQSSILQPPSFNPNQHSLLPTAPTTTEVRFQRRVQTRHNSFLWPRGYIWSQPDVSWRLQEVSPPFRGKEPFLTTRSLPPPPPFLFAAEDQPVLALTYRPHNFQDQKR